MREQVVAQVGRGVAVFLGDVAALEYFREGRENDFHVAQEGDSFNVLEVVLDFLFPSHCVAPVNLCKTAEALAHGVAAALFGGHKDHVAHELGSRPYHGHVALEDVEEFGEFVEARAAEELAVAREAHVVREEFALGVAGIGHGAELHEPEDAFVLAGARLREEGVPAHLDGTENRERNEDGAQAENCRERAEEIQDAFEEVAIHQSRTSQWPPRSPPIRRIEPFSLRLFICFCIAEEDIPTI